MTESVPIPPPSKPKVTAIIRRFIKEGVTPNWKADMPVFYKLWKDYPDLSFWERHELDFGMNTLNTMTWFLTEQGQSHLKSAWSTFRFTYLDTATRPDQTSILVVDKDEVSVYHPPTSRKAKTVADFLKRGD